MANAVSWIRWARSWLCVLAGLLVTQGLVVADTPQITVFYGPTQAFGSPGVPQRWANVLGRVTSSDGILSLAYTLNGGPPTPLSIGPDERRLSFEGDFVVEIDTADLLPGVNSVELAVVDGAADTNATTVTIDSTDGAGWPLPYTIDWSTAPELNDVLEVVDGWWSTAPGGVRLSDPAGILAYDRSLTLGDITWQDYEVAVEVTMHDFAPGALGPISGSATVGLTTSWQGHTTLLAGEQPHAGWRPQGGNLSYDFFYQGGERVYLGLGRDLQPTVFPAPSSFTLELDTTYWFKLRSFTLPGGDTDYRAKVWASGQPEPSEWLLAALEENDEQNVGSVLLTAHHVDVTFGNVDVTPILDDGTAPVVSNLQIDPFGDFARVTWLTDEPAIGTVKIGETLTYELGEVTTGVYRYNHQVTIPGLEFGQTYHLQVVNADKWGNEAIEADSVITTSIPPPAALVSDEFCGQALSGWTLHDPLGDTTLLFTGDEVELELDPATVHDYFLTDLLPRLQQPFDDGDFLVDVEFSQLLSAGQTYGFLFEGATPGLGAALRVELTHQGAGVQLVVGRFVDLEPVSFDVPFVDSGARFLRVGRSGSTWSIFHSVAGASWAVGPSFFWDQEVESIGIAAGNNIGVEHTCGVARFRNLAAPEPPDGITILASPLSVAACTGTPVVLSVDFVSPLPVEIAWRRDGVVMPGATDSTVEVSQPGIYDSVLDNGCQVSTSAPATVTLFGCAGDFLRGDSNGDGSTNLADAVHLLAHLFDAVALPCRDASDANDDGALDTADAIMILSYTFIGGPPPAAPFPACGPDPTGDVLGCDASSCP